MNKYFTLFAFLLSISVFSQAPNWAWARSSGGSLSELSYSICNDDSGNVIVVGAFGSQQIAFGSVSLNNVTGGNIEDIFVVKYNSSGSVIWARAAGSYNDDIPFSVCADDSGNIYVTGDFGGPTITFDTISLSSANASADIFLVKYDRNGNVMWAKRDGGTWNDYAYSISIDSIGFLYVCGVFRSDSIIFGTTTLLNSGAGDIFLAKYDPNGNVVWAEGFGGSDNDYANSVTVDAFQNILIVGTFNSSSINFGSTTLNNPNTPFSDLLITKLDVSGNVIWAKSEGGVYSENASSVRTDNSGNIFVTGHFSSPTITLGTITLTSAGDADMFLAKYDNAGNNLWSVSNGSDDFDKGNSICIDTSGNVYVLGTFRSDSIVFGTTQLNNASTWSYADIFISKYSSAGNTIWAKGLGEYSNDEAWALTIDANQNIYTAGYFNSTMNFDFYTLQSLSDMDVFVGRLDTLLNVSIVSTNTPCIGACSGTATANTSWGILPYSYLWSDGQTSQTAIGLCTGSYTVLVTDGIGAAVSAFVSISNPPLPYVSYNQSPTNMCVNWPVQTLSAGSPTGGIYSGTAITGNTFNPTIAGAGTFPIVYSYTDANGCTNSDTSFITVSLCSGIEDNNPGYELSVIPNPSSGIFTVQSENNLNETISITNILGEIIYSSEMFHDDQEIDLTSQPNGIYFVTVRNDMELFTQKIVIQK